MDMSNKTSDENVGSIEEDIKILQELMEDVEVTFAGWVDILNEREKKALKNLIQDYTRQKEMNEEHQKINGELREKVKELEEEKALLKKASNIAKEVNIEDITDVINESCKEFMSNYIPKQAVIDKIKELKLSGGSNEKDNVENLARELAIDVLQELLEGGK